jgi:hypothetical protein
MRVHVGCGGAAGAHVLVGAVRRRQRLQQQRPHRRQWQRLRPRPRPRPRRRKSPRRPRSSRRRRPSRTCAARTMRCARSARLSLSRSLRYRTWTRIPSDARLLTQCVSVCVCVCVCLYACVTQELDKHKDYARQFAEQRGGLVLAEVVLLSSSNTQANTQAYALKALRAFMDFGTGWEGLDDAFLCKVAPRRHGGRGANLPGWLGGAVCVGMRACAADRAAARPRHAPQHYRASKSRPNQAGGGGADLGRAHPRVWFCARARCHPGPSGPPPPPLLRLRMPTPTSTCSADRVWGGWDGRRLPTSPPTSGALGRTKSWSRAW